MVRIVNGRGHDPNVINHPNTKHVRYSICENTSQGQGTCPRELQKIAKYVLVQCLLALMQNTFSALRSRPD